MLSMKLIGALFLSVSIFLAGCTKNNDALLIQEAVNKHTHYLLDLIENQAFGSEEEEQWYRSCFATLKIVEGSLSIVEDVSKVRVTSSGECAPKAIWVFKKDANGN